MMFEIVLSIAALLCLIVIVFGCLDCLFKKKNRFEAFGIRETAHAEHNAAFSVDIFDADSISENVIIEPLPDILSKVSAVPVLRPRITCTERGKQEATLSLLSAQKSFPRNHLTYLTEIGSGWFGKAIESQAIQIVTGSYTNHVVVKMLKDDASKLEQKQFMDEVIAFRCLEHTHLISLLGQCTETTPYLVILEFASHGNLKTYLVRHRLEVDTLISTNRLVNFALGAASGLACLHRHDYIHNDLAARNCLVMSDYTLKIGDYGITDHLFKDEYFNTGTELLPVRWMAPETLIQRDGTWTSRKCNKTSDIWSLGILLWEICSLGERPYDSLTDESVLQSVVLDRLVLPSDTNRKLPFKVKLWSLMIQCWEEPSQRLDAEQAHHFVEQLKVQLDAMAAGSHFDQKWNHLGPNKGQSTRTNLERGSTIASNVSTDFSSTQDRPSLYYDALESPNVATRGDVIVDIDSSTTSTSMGSDHFSAPNIFMQPLRTAVNHNVSTIQQSGSLYLTPSALLVQQRMSTTVSVSPGLSSTSQFYSLQSSPSSEYMTISDSNVVSDIKEETVIETSSIDKDFSLHSESLSLHMSMDETLTGSVNQDGKSIVKTNNVASKFVSSPQCADTDLSVQDNTSLTAHNEDFADFESAVTAGSNSFFSVKHVLENDLYNQDASLIRADFTPSASPSETDMFSEFVSSTNNTFRVDSDRNAHANFITSSFFSSPPGINSTSVISNAATPSRSFGSNVRGLVGAAMPSEPEANSRINNVFTDTSDYNKNFQVPEMSNGLEATTETTSGKVHVSQEEISIESDQDRTTTNAQVRGPSIGLETTPEQSSGKVHVTCEQISVQPDQATTDYYAHEMSNGLRTATEMSSDKVLELQEEISVETNHQDQTTTDFQSPETSNGLERTPEMCLDKVLVYEKETLVRKAGSDQPQDIVSFDSASILPSMTSDSSFLADSLDSGTIHDVLLLRPKSFTELQKHSENVDEMGLSHSPVIVEGSSTSLFSDLDDVSNTFTSGEPLDQKSSSEPTQPNEPTITKDDDLNTEVGQDNVDTSNKNESNSAESGIHSHAMTESPSNYVNNNYSHVDSRMYLSDSPNNTQNTPLSDSSDAVIPEGDYEQDAWPLMFKSNLYRCSRINLTEDSLNAGPALEDFGSPDDLDNNCQEVSQSPVDSDTDSTNSTSGSEQEYICSGQNISGQPMTSSPDTATTNLDSAAPTDTEPSSPVEFDEYALQIASEIYLSRGLKSPRVFEIPPLETIPEHMPMPGTQEDSNYTPSDTSSVEVRYEELFGSDSYEWDDFYGDPLIGKDTSLRHTTHQHNPSFREHDVSDWSMDIDSESIASGLSIQSETSLNTSTQPEQLPLPADISVDSGKSMQLFSELESTATPSTKNADSSRETLSFSLLSHLQSPIVSSVSSVNHNNFYTLTEKYDLETDSSSDGLTSPPATITSVIEPLSSSTHLSSSPPLQSFSALLPSGLKMTEQHSDLVSSKALDPSKSSSWSYTSEEAEVVSEQSDSEFDPGNSFLGHNLDLVAGTPNRSAPSENIESEEQLNTKDLNPELDVWDQDNTFLGDSTSQDKQDVFMESQDSKNDTDVMSAQIADNSFDDH